MKIRFWGTRGSLAKPGLGTLRYGGNTTCVEVRADDGTLIVLDCGTGAHALGQALMAEGQRPLRGHLLISHTHWDHIQGFPFFTPLFIPGNEWDIYAPGGMAKRLEETLAGQMEYTYFPVSLAQLGATIRFHELVEGTFTAGGVQVTTRYLNHPAVTLGYRLVAGGASVVYALDHEPHGGALMTMDGHERSLGANSTPPPPHQPVHQEDRAHVEFLNHADLVIHDGQYTSAEYPSKRGWGHTPMEQAVDFAGLAGARWLAITHHDPLRDDATLASLEAQCQERAATFDGLRVFLAAEGQEVLLEETAPEHVADGVEAAPQAPPAEIDNVPLMSREQTVLLVDDDQDILELLHEVLMPEGFRIVTANDGEKALSLARSQRPALILLDWIMPGMSGLDVVKALRADEDTTLRNIPVVLLTALNSPSETKAGFAAGATDYLTKPFTPAHVRTRVREWLLRSHAWAGGAL